MKRGGYRGHLASLLLWALLTFIGKNWIKRKNKEGGGGEVKDHLASELKPPEKTGGKKKQKNHTKWNWIIKITSKWVAGVDSQSLHAAENCCQRLRDRVEGDISSTGFCECPKFRDTGLFACSRKCTAWFLPRVQTYSCYIFFYSSIHLGSENIDFVWTITRNYQRFAGLELSLQSWNNCC